MSEADKEQTNGRAARPPEPAVQEQPPAPEGAPENASADPAAQEDPRLAQLQKELETARARVNELARAYQAVQQDREEFKQRLSRERERMIDVEKGNAARALLEGIDELDRALAATPDDTSPLAQGVRLVRENLLAKAHQTGIERVSVLGKPFDPNLAEAVDMELTTERDADQTVVVELAAGYRLKDKIVRPARVKVAKYVEPAKA